MRAGASSLGHDRTLGGFVQNTASQPDSGVATFNLPAACPTRWTC